MIEKVRANLIDLPRGWKRAILIGVDFVMLALSLWASFSLRLDRWVPPQDLEALLILLAGPVVAIPIFIRMGL
ncbi:MAG: polysaccharide biosynthesis protein, partial [Devosia sp.]